MESASTIVFISLRTESIFKEVSAVSLEAKEVLSLAGSSVLQFVKHINAKAKRGMEILLFNIVKV